MVSLLICLCGCGRGINKRIIIISHGSNPDGCKMFMYQELGERLEKKGYNVYLFDYTGFGSAPDPTDLKNAKCYHWKEDLEKAINKAMKLYGEGEIILIGHSFGGSPTVAVGYEDERIDKVISIAPPRRMMELFFNNPSISGLGWVQQRMKEDMKLEEFPPQEILWDIHKDIILENFADTYWDKPLLFITESQASTADKIFMETLVKSMSGDVTLKEIPNTNHYFGAAYKITNEKMLNALIEEIEKWIKT